MWRRKSLKYLYRWTLCKILQHKEMMGIRLHYNQELHSRNRFEENFAKLKAPSLWAFVFTRAWGKFDYLASNSWRRKLEVEKTNYCAQPLMEPLSLKPMSSMKGWTNKIASTFHGAFEQVARGIHKRLSIKIVRSASNFRCWKLEAEREKNSLDLQLLMLKVGGWMRFCLDRSSKTCWKLKAKRKNNSFNLQLLTLKVGGWTHFCLGRSSKIPKRPNAKCFALNPSQSFQTPRSKGPRRAKWKKDCIQPFWSFQVPSSKAPQKAECKKFAFSPSTSF